MVNHLARFVRAHGTKIAAVLAVVGLAACGSHSPADKAKASAAASAVASAIASVQSTPGGQQVVTALNNCAPLKGGQLQVVLTSTKGLPFGQKTKVWGARGTALHYFLKPQSRAAFYECFQGHVNVTQQQWAQVKKCAETTAVASVRSWTSAKKWLLGSLPDCYSKYAVASPSPTPSASS